jgi:superoxide reductase
MNLLEENTTDAATEKHVPVIERVDGGIKVKVGEAAHPMADDHYIEWIELTAGDETHIAFLSPGGAPEAFFPVTADPVTAREYCTLHGFWKA